MTEAVDSPPKSSMSRGVTSVDLVIILGDGLGSVADGLEDAIVIPYADLPGFPEGPVAPDGVLIVAEQDGVKVAYMRGRAEFHRNADAAAMAAPIETLAMLGAQNLIVTAGVGSVRADMHPSNLVLITDHINFGGINPLIGMSADGGLVGLTDAYDPKMFRRLKRATLHCGVQTHEGVMMWFSGPTFETPAEVKMSRILGADVVTMSMVPEVDTGPPPRHERRRRRRGHLLRRRFQGGAPNPSTALKQAQAAAIGLRRLARLPENARDRRPIAASAHGRVLAAGNHPPQARRRRARRDEIAFFVDGLAQRRRSATTRSPPSPWRCSFAAWIRGRPPISPAR